MRYASLGDIPAKRHVQFRENGAPARRGGAGLRGLLGQRVDPLPPVEPVPGQGGRRVRADRARGVGAGHPRPPAHQHARPRAVRRPGPGPAAAPVQRRRRDRDLHPGGRGGLLLPRRRGRRGRLRPRGRRGAGDDLRLAAVPQARLRRDPARHDLPLPLRRPAALADLLHAGRDRDAEPLPQPLRPAARARAVLAPRLPPAGRRSRPTASAASTTSRCASAAATRTTSSTTTRSTSWAGTATSTRTRSTSTTSSPRPAACTSRRRRTRRSRARTSSSARSARACSTGTTNAIALPYHHSNVQSEEMIYYVDGQFGSRKGVDIGAITLHPSGLPHGPQPGLVEKSLGVTRTEELAVMCDTFRPLKLTRAVARPRRSQLRALLVRGGRGAARPPRSPERRLTQVCVTLTCVMTDVNPFQFGALALDEAFTDREAEIAELRPTSATGRTWSSSPRGATASPRWSGARRRSSRASKVLVAQRRPDDDADAGQAGREARARDPRRHRLAAAAREGAAADLRRPEGHPHHHRRRQHRRAVVLVLVDRAAGGHRRHDRAAARAAGRARRRAQAPGRARARRVPGGDRHRPAAAAADARGLPAAAGGRARLPRLQAPHAAADVQRRERAVLAQRQADRARRDRARRVRRRTSSASSSAPAASSPPRRSTRSSTITAGHPYATQELCYFAWQEAAPRARRGRPTSTPPWRKRPALRARALLAAVGARLERAAAAADRARARAGSPAVGRLPRRHNLPAPSTVQRAVEALERDELVARDRGRVRIVEPFLAAWLVRDMRGI